MEPLLLLRDAVMKNDTVTAEGDSLVFQATKQSLPKNAPTGYRSNRGRGDPYNLETVWFLSQQGEKAFRNVRDYVEECNKNSIARVLIADVRDLLNYLRGEVEDCPGISAAAAAQTSTLVGAIQIATIDQEKDDQQKIHPDDQKEVEKNQPQQQLQSSLQDSLPLASAAANAMVDSSMSMDVDTEDKQDLPIDLQPSSILPSKQSDALTFFPAQAIKAEQGLSLIHAISKVKKLQRTRNSILCMKNRCFKFILDSLNSCILEKKDQKGVNHNNPNQNAQNLSKPNQNAYAYMNPEAPANQIDFRGDRYRVTQDQFWRESYGADFTELGIDPSGTFKQKSVEKSGTKSERSSAYSSAPSSRDSSYITDFRSSQSIAASTGSRMSGASGYKTNPNSSIKKLRELRPIIIIPGGFQSIVNIGNAKAFLENGEFNLSKDSSNRNLTSEITFSRPVLSHHQQALAVAGISFADKKTEYVVVNNAFKLQQEDWKRVVAVISNGATWQFKNWPVEDPIKLFRTVRGYYFYHDDDSAPTDVVKWGVKCIGVSKTKRHLDISIQIDFWKDLEAFMIKRYPDYIF